MKGTEERASSNAREIDSVVFNFSSRVPIKVKPRGRGSCRYFDEGRWIGFSVAREINSGLDVAS